MNSNPALRPVRLHPVRLGAVLLVAALLLAGCSTTREPGDLYKPTDVGVLVLDATLIVDRPAPEIRISETLDPGTPYTPEVAAVRAADVRLTRNDGAVVLYAENPSAPGHYRPEGVPASILPETSYTLTVEASRNRRATATTVTPARFSVERWVLLNEQTLAVERQLRTFAELGDEVYTAPENQVVYQQGLLEARIRRNGAVAYQAGLVSLDLDSDRVIEADFLDEEDYAQLDRQNASPALEAADSLIRLPWFAIFWAGRYRITIHAIDRNWYDFIRSFPQGDGGFGIGGNAGDNFERPLFHVEGGIGLFGSAAVDSIGFVILPDP